MQKDLTHINYEAIEFDGVCLMCQYEWPDDNFTLSIEEFLSIAKKGDVYMSMMTHKQN